MRKLWPTRPLRPTAGVTLLEVLVAIVLLLVGVLMVVRIYPTGLELIRHNGLRSLGLRLDEEQMERLKNRPDTLPGSVVALDANGNPDALADRDAEFETDDPPWQSTLTSEGYEQLTSLLFRRVFRENAVIPASGLYLLAGSLPTRGSEGVTTRYTRSLHNSPAELSARRDRRYYAIDYTAGQVWFENDTTANRAFLIDYAYIDGNTGQQQWILEEAHTVLQSLVGAPLTYVTLNAMATPGSAIVQGSETVRRLLAPGSAAPYGFNPLSDRGVLEFDPVNAGLPIEVSYTVLDWRILPEEKTVALEPGPNNTTQAVIYTTLFFIQNQQEDPNYGGLDLAGNLPDVQVVDVNNPRNAVSVDATLTNYRRGRLVLTGNAYEGQQVRVFYRTIDQWAVQPMKASVTYYEDWRNQNFSPAAPSLTAYNPAQADPRRYRYGLVGGEMYLGFYPSEAGQAVVVDYRYDDDPTDSVPPVRVEGEMHTVPDPDATLRLCLVRLNTPVVGNRQFTIDRVHGTSLKVRATWHEKTSIRRVDLDTYLTRP